MRTPRMRVGLLACFSICASQALAQLFYDDCTDGTCRKAFIEKKEKVSDDQYLVQTMFLTYRQRHSTDADEQRRSARVSCNKSKPMVTWDSGKAQMIDKKLFAKTNPKKGKITEPEKPAKYDETASLWRKICPPH